MLLLFASCAFPVHVWSILGLLREMPAWILRLSAWELVGVVAYTLALALLESTVLWLVVAPWIVLLPGRVLGKHLVAQGSTVVFVTALWAVAAHYQADRIRLWRLGQFAVWSILYLLSIAAAYWIVRRYAPVARLVRSFVERLAVLSWFYVAIDLVSVIVVIVRNIPRRSG